MNPADELAAAGVATVYEAYGRVGLIEREWQVLNPSRPVAGPAVTALCANGDNRAVHEAMDHVTPGSVLVISMDDPVPSAVVGDLLATQAVAHGAVGILVDAAVRDTRDLTAMPLTVLTRWRNARGATKESRGRVQVPLTIAGTTVHPGDMVVLDDDGATAVGAADVDRALVAVRARIAKEADLRNRWAAGELSYDAYGLRDQDLQGASS